MTATPSSSAAKTLSQQFLEAYLADPTKNPYGQFYKTPYSGSLVSELPRAYEKYGALSDPLALAQQLRSAGTAPGAVSQAARNLALQTKQAREANYQAYKEAYGKAEDLFRQQRAAGFATPEAEQQARQGLAAVREATFLPYLANRGYLEAQQRLQERAGTMARMGSSLERRREMLQKRGMSEEDVKASLKPFKSMLRRQEERGGLMYGAVKDVGRGGEVQLGDRLSLGESLGKMMTDATWAPVEAAWRKENAPGGGYGYASRPEAAQTPAVSAAPTQAAPAAMRQGPIQSLDLSRGGSAQRFNMADLRAARQEGYSDKQIRQYLKKNEGLVGEGKRERIMGALRRG